MVMEISNSLVAVVLSSCLDLMIDQKLCLWDTTLPFKIFFTMRTQNFWICFRGVFILQVAAAALHLCCDFSNMGSDSNGVFLCATCLPNDIHMQLICFVFRRIFSFVAVWHPCVQSQVVGSRLGWILGRKKHKSDTGDSHAPGHCWHLNT